MSNYRKDFDEQHGRTRYFGSKDEQEKPRSSAFSNSPLQGQSVADRKSVAGTVPTSHAESQSRLRANSPFGQDKTAERSSIFQRDPKTLQTPSVKANTDMLSLKERLEALKQAQNEKKSVTPPSPFAGQAGKTTPTSPLFAQRQGLASQNQTAPLSSLSQAQTNAPRARAGQGSLSDQNQRPPLATTAQAQSARPFSRDGQNTAHFMAQTSPRAGQTDPRGLNRSPLTSTYRAKPSASPFGLKPPVSAQAPDALGGGTVQISQDEFAQLREFLYQQTGIYVGDNRKYLVENRLSSRLRALNLRNFAEYNNYLRFDVNRTQELNSFYENMTTNETSFFRNMAQLKVFEEKVLSKVIAEQRQKGQKKLHIWSAGCSSGEEPYTIAIIIMELLKGEISSWNIRITANDLSLAMIDLAKKGLYSEYSLRTTPPELVQKYFQKQQSAYKVLPQVQKLVNFGQINLASGPQLKALESSHIIFCRNVIIYFDDQMKKHVISSFYDNLLPGGYLLIGHSESLHNISRAFIPEHYPEAIIYKKAT